MIMRAIAGAGGAAVGSQGGSGGTPNKGEGASSPSRKFVNLTSPKAGQNGGSPKKPKSPGKGTPASKDHTPHARWATSATPPPPTHTQTPFLACLSCSTSRCCAGFAPRRTDVLFISVYSAPEPMRPNIDVELYVCVHQKQSKEAETHGRC